MLKVSITFRSERLALFFAKLSRRLTNDGFADDHLGEAIKYIQASISNGKWESPTDEPPLQVYQHPYDDSDDDCPICETYKHEIKILREALEAFQRGDKDIQKIVAEAIEQTN